MGYGGGPAASISFGDPAADDPAPTVGPLTEEQDYTYEKVVTDKNKMGHIFDQAKHNLGNLVKRFGSERAVVRDVVLKLGRVQPDRNGVFLEQRIIGGEKVEIQGALVNGRIRISDFWARR